MKNALDYISIKGFRSIREIETLELRPINILIGANGSGKSNFVSVFSFLNSIRQGHLRSYTAKRAGADRILHFGPRTTSRIEIEVSFNNGKNGYGLTLSPTEINTFYVQEEKCWLWEAETQENFFVDFGPSLEETKISESCSDLRSDVQSCLDSWRIYHFHDTSDQSPIKKTADVDDNRFLRSDGSNLASYLFLLKERYPKSYQFIRKIVQRVTPFFDDFRLEPLRHNESKIRLEWIHKSAPDQYFDVSSFSDGTLRFICLATLLLQPADQRPSTILLDEPELGLHPYAITMLASMIQSASVDTQVIMSTQSSLLLDCFEPEDVLVAELQSGATTLRRLQSSELAIWLEDYSLGQLWEKNQFGGRPKNG
jgi:predicted ATPase